MDINLKLVSGCKFEGTNSLGNKVVIEGSPDMGGKNEGARPMEIILMGLASCSSLDVMHILQKGKAEVLNLEVDVQADRADAIPAVFTKINLHFKAKGSFTIEKLERAISLSIEKYCSVTKMLESTVKITTSYEVMK
jgi:putative redox protein